MNVQLEMTYNNNENLNEEINKVSQNPKILTIFTGYCFFPLKSNTTITEFFARGEHIYHQGAY